MFSFANLSRIHASLRSLYADQSTCAACKDAPYGYALDVSRCTCCDDCLRRTLVYERISYESIWKILRSGSTLGMELCESICTAHDLFLGEDLTRSIRSSGNSSEFFFPTGGPDSTASKSFYETVKRRRSGGSGPDQFWSTVVRSKKKGKGRKSATSAPSESDSKSATPSNTAWVLTDEEIGNADFDKLPVPAIITLMLKKDIFLTYGKFLEIIPPYVEDNFQKLHSISPNLFDEVEETVDRWVKIGNDDTGLAIAKGIGAVIDHQIDPELSKSGDSSSLGFYKHLSKVTNDTSCGVLRTCKINLRLLKKEYVDNHGTYYNLAYTVAIHCPGTVCSPSRTYRRRRCMAHGIGCPDHYTEEIQQLYVVREPWIPASYGVKVPSNVLTAAKPLIAGFTGAALAAGNLASSLISYLTSSATLIAPTFTTLQETIQNFLISRFGSASSVPKAMIGRLVGLSISDAADIIFAKTPDPPAKPKVQAAASSSKTTSSQGGKRDHPYQGFTDKQVSRLTDSFGGDFRAYLTIKKKYKLKGDINLVKLSNYFDKGKPKFGKLKPAQVAEKCLN